MKNKPWTNRKLVELNESKVADKKPATIEARSSSKAHKLSHSSSTDMSTPEKSVANNSFVHTVEVRLLNREQSADTAGIKARNSETTTTTTTTTTTINSFRYSFNSCGDRRSERRRR